MRGRVCMSKGRTDKRMRIGMPNHVLDRSNKKDTNVKNPGEYSVTSVSQKTVTFQEEKKNRRAVLAFREA